MPCKNYSFVLPDEVRFRCFPISKNPTESGYVSIDMRQKDAKGSCLMVFDGFCCIICSTGDGHRPLVANRRSASRSDCKAMPMNRQCPSNVPNTYHSYALSMYEYCKFYVYRTYFILWLKLVNAVGLKSSPGHPKIMPKRLGWLQDFNVFLFFVLRLFCYTNPKPEGRFLIADIAGMGGNLDVLGETNGQLLKECDDE